MSTRAKFLLLLLVSARCSGVAAQPAPDLSPPESVQAARALAKADSDFAARAAKDVPGAYVEYYADDGIAFVPEAAKGKDYWRAQKDFAARLMWQPVFAVASRAGDLGYTTGPWEMKGSTEKNSTVYGRYVTLWTRQSDGNYRIALDIETENAQPPEPPSDLQLVAPNPIAGERPLEDARRIWLKAQRSFLAAAHEDVGKAILDFADENIFVLRQNSFPAFGPAAARLMLEADHGKLTFTFSGSRLSSSGDLACTYGAYAKLRGNITEHGEYVMIWRMDLNGDWKLAVDVQKRRPEKS